MPWRGWTCQGSSVPQYAIVVLEGNPKVIKDKEVRFYTEQGYRTMGTGWYTRAEAEAVAGINKPKVKKKKEK